MIERFRESIPALQQRVNGKPLVYCDWAATTQVPQCVIDSVRTSMMLRGNVRRGVHNLGAESTKRLEASRTTIANFIGAPAGELILTSGTTHGLNMLAQSAGLTLSEGDVVVLSALEHHSQLLPWQRMSKERGFSIEILPIDASGRMDIMHLRSILAQNTVRIIACSMVSNVLGTIQPVQEIVDCIEQAGHRQNIRMILDAAQAVAHIPIDVKTLGVDALIFGGHKLYGPTGTGALWIQEDWRCMLQPSLVGGGSIASVSYRDFESALGTRGFEPGTPNVSGFVGLARAIEWIESIGWDSIQKQEQTLLEHMSAELLQIPAVQMLCSAPDIPLFTFAVDRLHAHDLGTMLDLEGIVVRTGHHCTQPLHDAKGMESTTRISLSFLNTIDECQYIVERLQFIIGAFS